MREIRDGSTDIDRHSLTNVVCVMEWTNRKCLQLGSRVQLEIMWAIIILRDDVRRFESKLVKCDKTRVAEIYRVMESAKRDEYFNLLCYGELAGWLWNAVEGRVGASLLVVAGGHEA